MQCPAWCVQEHPVGESPEDAWHRSATVTAPVVGWFPAGALEPEAAAVHVGLMQPPSGGEVRVRIEADGFGELDLDVSSAVRIAAGIRAVVPSGLLADAG